VEDEVNNDFLRGINEWTSGEECRPLRIRDRREGGRIGHI
jgi:hypothetical protein